MIPTKTARRLIEQLLTKGFIAPKYRDGWRHWRSFYIDGVTGTPLPKENEYILENRLLSRRFKSRRWFTSEQLKALKLRLRRGERGIEYTSSDGWVTRLYNEDQIQPQYVARRVERGQLSFKPIPQIEQLISSKEIVVNHTPTYPHFRYEYEEIFLPPPERFRSVGEYYKTLLHEVGHWGVTEYTLELEGGYDFEELVVELFSVMMAERFGLDYDVDSTVSYLNMYVAHWGDTRRRSLKRAYHSARLLYTLFFKKS